MKRLLSALLFASLFSLAGCGGTGSTGTATTTGPTPLAGATNIYLVQPNGSSVLIFSANATGTASTTGTLQGPAGVVLSAIAVDKSGQIYLAGSNGGQTEVAVYAAGATGAATPLRTFMYANPNLVPAIAVDSSGNIYVQDVAPEIQVFASGTAGTSPVPKATISGSNTLMTTYPVGLAIDSLNGYIYSSNLMVSPTRGVQGGVIARFPITGSGNVVATSANVSTTYALYGLATDASGNLYESVDQFTGFFSALDKYILQANGSYGAYVSTASNLGLTNVGGGTIAVDAAGNVYMLTQNPTAGQFGISVFSQSTTTSTWLAPRNSFTSNSITSSSSATVAGVMAVY